MQYIFGGEKGEFIRVELRLRSINTTVSITRFLGSSSNKDINSKSKFAFKLLIRDCCSAILQAEIKQQHHYWYDFEFIHRIKLKMKNIPTHTQFRSGDPPSSVVRSEVTCWWACMGRTRPWPIQRHRETTKTNGKRTAFIPRLSN